MKQKHIKYTYLKTILLCIFCCVQVCMAEEKNEDSDTLPLYIIEPVTCRGVEIWVPAIKQGPIINRSCRPRKNCNFETGLQSTVLHEKDSLCPDYAARFLAEYSHVRFRKVLPLTIEQGWQWKGLTCEVERDYGRYDLEALGGSWENSWEAVLSIGQSDIKTGWLDDSDEEQMSSINVEMFSNMRVRDGYPKKCKL